MVHVFVATKMILVATPANDRSQGLVKKLLSKVKDELAGLAG